MTLMYNEFNVLQHRYYAGISEHMNDCYIQHNKKLHIHDLTKYSDLQSNEIMQSN